MLALPLPLSPALYKYSLASIDIHFGADRIGDFDELSGEALRRTRYQIDVEIILRVVLLLIPTNSRLHRTRTMLLLMLLANSEGFVQPSDDRRPVGVPLRPFRPLFPNPLKSDFPDGRPRQARTI